ncbi:hypothetical protein AC578_4510 [Pseudocercospora eumusae]|uniref:Uncharacterized protein n=1 Tax=Pseudocercospora eumusae TaxID=321146 RepID=A0A139GWC4_9PEZI|nr:hypothetical protein AC578_4510 [Pseudocercospora eumusae]
MAADNKRSLQDLLESLPRELYDEIRELTFTAPPPTTVITIDEGYQPPSVAQVNYTNRVKFQSDYFKCGFVGYFADIEPWLNTVHRSAAAPENVACWILEQAKYVPPNLLPMMVDVQDWFGMLFGPRVKVCFVKDQAVASIIKE